MTDFADLFASQPLSEAAFFFLPVWLLALWVGLKKEPVGSDIFRGPLFERFAFRVTAHGMILLPLLVWAGISTYRTWAFWQSLALSHGPDSREVYVIALGNLGAGAITCCLIAAALTACRRPAARLGLRGMCHFTSIMLILGVSLDAAFLLHFCLH